MPLHRKSLIFIQLFLGDCLYFGNLLCISLLFFAPFSAKAQDEAILKFSRAKNLWLNDKDNDAIKTFDSIISESSSTYLQLAAYYYKGDILFEHQKFSEAKSLFNKIIQTAIRAEKKIEAPSNMMISYEGLIHNSCDYLYHIHMEESNPDSALYYLKYGDQHQYSGYLSIGEDVQLRFLYRATLYARVFVTKGQVDSAAYWLIPLALKDFPYSTEALTELKNIYIVAGKFGSFKNILCHANTEMKSLEKSTIVIVVHWDEMQIPLEKIVGKNREWEAEAKLILIQERLVEKCQYLAN